VPPSIEQRSTQDCAKPLNPQDSQHHDRQANPQHNQESSSLGNAPFRSQPSSQLDQRFESQPNDQLDSELDRELDAIAYDSSFTLESVLKENDWERTELIHDASGHQFIRKYLSKEKHFGAQYKIVARFSNPALPHIYALYDLADRQVVLMEYLRGKTLRQWILSNGPLPDNQARMVLRDLCVGIAALHHCAPPIVHRDIKPDNVIRTQSGISLIDFGIARRYDEQAHQDTSSWGTMGYAAPEQFGFGQSSPRTDIYALGMLYRFLLTGRDPEPEQRKHLSEEFDIPTGARTIIAQCIELDPIERPSSIEAFCALLGHDMHQNGSTSFATPYAYRNEQDSAKKTPYNPLNQSPNPNKRNSSAFASSDQSQTQNVLQNETRIQDRTQFLSDSKPQYASNMQRATSQQSYAAHAQNNQRIKSVIRIGRIIVNSIVLIALGILILGFAAVMITPGKTLIGSDALMYRLGVLFLMLSCILSVLTLVDPAHIIERIPRFKHYRFRNRFVLALILFVVCFVLCCVCIACLSPTYYASN
jgi:serine/threonine protein kinase